MTRGEALAQIDKMISDLNEIVPKCQNRGIVFKKWGIFVSAIAKNLQEIRWAL